MTFKPFADDASVLTIDDLTLENGTDRIVMSSAEFTRDHDGLAKVERAIAALRTISDALRADPHLPRSLGPERVEAPVEVSNPFASKG